MINWVKIAIIVGYVAIISAIIVGAYNYYQTTQRQMRELHLQNSMLSSAVQEQKRTIENLNAAVQQQQKINKEVNLAVKKAENDLDKLQNTLSKHSLKSIASKKATLLQKRINNGTREILRCFEVATGGAITPNEKNNSCSSLFDS